MDLSITEALLASLGGFFAGVMNTVAGGGSMVTLPILLFLGLDIHTANGTNRIAILLQNVVGSWQFHRKGIGRPKKALLLAVPACLGSLVGAYLARQIDPQLFRLILGLIFLGMLPVLLADPKRWIEAKIQPITSSDRPSHKLSLLFFGLGIYGGFLQAGIGVFLLAALVLGAGTDLLEGNALKVMVVGLYTAVALILFVGWNQVHWEIGLVLALGNMSGAAIGVHLATTRGTVWLHRALITIVAGSAIWLIFDAVRNFG